MLPKQQLTSFWFQGILGIKEHPENPHKKIRDSEPKGASDK
jgi:hypothetical protein